MYIYIDIDILIYFFRYINRGHLLVTPFRIFAIAADCSQGVYSNIIPEAYLRLCGRPMIKLFAEKVNNFPPLTIFAS